MEIFPRGEDIQFLLVGSFQTQPPQKSGRLEQHHFFGGRIENSKHPPGRRSHYISLYSSWFFEGSLDGWYFLGGHFQTCHGVKNRKC